MRIIIILCAVAVLAGGWWVLHSSQAGKQQGAVFVPAGTPLEASTQGPALPLGPHRQAPAGYKEYYDSRYRFSFFYPDDLAVKAYDEGSGAATITFQNPDTVQGFQIFVVPYGATQVTEDQFRKDEPSGVREGLQGIVVDGATGASFYSTNPALGDTAEVWFIHGGHLYEVTTLKPLAPWLSGIMQSWKFI